MKPSLLSRIFSDNAADASLIDQWIKERDVDQALRKLPDEPLPFMVDAERLGKAAAPYDETVEAGQIRILSPDLVSDDTAFPYVAVLDRWMEDLWLVAPFSPYGTPATDGEMATGIMLLGQRVLQCWNVRTAHGSLVGKSYVMGLLDENVRKDALALFRHAMSGAALPEGFKALVGAPVLSKADPRREYLAESALRYEPLTAAARRLEAKLALMERIEERRDSLRLSAAFMRPSYGKRDFALAAGDKAGQTTETFSVPAFGVELDVKHSPSEGTVRLVVYRGGKRDAATLEGFIIADKDVSPVGEIREGVLVSKATALADGFLMLDPESLEQVPIKKIKKEGE